MTARKKTVEEPVVAEEYVEDEWDLTTESTEEDEQVVTRRGRQKSAFKIASDAFDKAHADADRARVRIAKVQPLIDNLNALEAEEVRTWEALQDELKQLGG